MNELKEIDLILSDENSVEFKKDISRKALILYKENFIDFYYDLKA